MVTGGVVKLNKGDTLSVFVHATVDNSFSISPDSSFSVIYLTALDSIYAAGMQLMLSESIVQSVKDASSWKKVRYWVTNRANTAPGVFFHGMCSHISLRSIILYKSFFICKQGEAKILQKAKQYVSNNQPGRDNRNFKNSNRDYLCATIIQVLDINKYD